MVELAELTAEHFADQIGCAYRVELSGHRETLTLESVEPGQKSPLPEAFRDPFSLIFRGESKTVQINQAVVPMDCEKYGRLDLFIVPIGRNDDGTIAYQAVFC